MSARLEALKAMLERLGQVHEIEGLMVEPLNLVDDLLADRAGADAPKWECSGCRKQFAGEWQEVCPNCGRENYWTGSFYVSTPDLRAQLAQCIADGQRMAGQLEAAETRAEQGEAQAREARREAHVLATEWEARRDHLVRLLEEARGQR